jgi:AcrR family transcriptional regulator
MAQNRRERLHDATREEIKSAARQQMKAEGTAAISLRAIARQLGMTAPALYRYYASRDDLVTALVVDAYHSQADWLEAECEKRAADDHAGRLLTFTLAYREWSLAHPEDYALIYGTPIPGYHAPWEVTAPAAQRNMRYVLSLFKAAWQAGVLPLPAEYAHPPAGLHDRLADAARLPGYDVPIPLLCLAVITWGHVQGLISLELFGHLVFLGDQAGEVYKFEAEVLLKRLGVKLASHARTHRTRLHESASSRQ